MRLSVVLEGRYTGYKPSELIEWHLPSIFSFGITQSSKMTFDVEVARTPSLSSFLPNDSPGVSLGTIKALIPRY